MKNSIERFYYGKADRYYYQYLRAKWIYTGMEVDRAPSLVTLRRHLKISKAYLAYLNNAEPRKFVPKTLILKITDNLKGWVETDIDFTECAIKSIENALERKGQV